MLERLVSTARVADLAAQADALQLKATTGISHTRWATHGAPTPDNAHPHLSGGEIAVVHNGIIENYEALREQLKAQGYVFRTQTDTEVIAHLVHAHWHAKAAATCSRAVQRAIAEFQRRVRDRRDLDARARARRRRAAGQPAPRRHRRRRSLPRVGRIGAAAGHAARRVPRGGRRRRRAPRVVRDLRRAGQRVDAHVVDVQGERRRGRARAVPALHAEGDLRAAARGRRHARRHRVDRSRRCSARAPPRSFRRSTRC